MIKIKSMCVALNLFCFGHFIPIPKISTPAKVIVAAIHSARATAAKLEIMDGFAFDVFSFDDAVLTRLGLFLPYQNRS